MLWNIYNRYSRAKIVMALPRLSANNAIRTLRKKMMSADISDFNLISVACCTHDQLRL